MKKETIVKDPVTGKAKTIIVSDTPITSVELLSQAAKGYISEVKGIVSYPETSIFSRDVAKMLCSVKLPKKNITTPRSS